MNDHGQCQTYFSQKSKPTLACVIVSYNYENYIGRAIESVLRQSKFLEIIVVDNASSDNSWEIICSYGIEKSVRLDRNYGQLGACQYGLEMTDAQFILFLDSDDEIVPGAIEKIIALLDDKVAKIQFPLIPIDQDNNVIAPPFPRLRNGSAREELLREIEREGCYSTPPTSGNVLSRDLCKLLAEVDYENSGDGICLLAAPLFGEVVSVSEPLGLYRVHGSNISNIGRRATTQTVLECLSRFSDRLNHFERIADSHGIITNIRPHTRTSYWLQQLFVLEKISSRTPRVSLFILVIWRLLASNQFKKHKAQEISYYIFIYFLSSQRAFSLMTYRAKISKRSNIGALKSILFASAN